MRKKMNIKWYRKNNISKDEYDSFFQETKPFLQEEKNCKKSKLEKAYNSALKTRELEINLYWERTKYFWAFITTIYIAYFNVLVQIYDKEHGSIVLAILSFLGFFFSSLWLFTSKASKHWQENWENHIDLLEDKITGPLFKIYKLNSSFSVSKINIVVGWVVSTFAFGLYVFDLAEFCKTLVFISPIFMFICLILLTILGFVVTYFIVKGNAENSGKIEFDLKIYNEESYEN